MTKLSEPVRDKNGMPYEEAFAFGLYECAGCGEGCFGNRIKPVLARPIFADFQETEILIPAGRQSFHPECWEIHKPAQTAS